MDDLNSECGQEIKRRIIDMVHEMAHDGVIWSRDHNNPVDPQCTVPQYGQSQSE